MNHKGCEHLLRYKLTHIGDFHKLYSCVIACCTEDDLKAKARISKCFKCGNHSWRLHACLFCIFVGCYDSSHIHDHARANHHRLAIDLDHGQIYCFECKNYVYDAEIDAIKKRRKLVAAETLGIIEPHLPWEPTADEITLMQIHPKRINLSKNSCFGLRGLINQGDTCYMNCVIQVLVHTPLLRNYFFSDQHICQPKDNASESNCLACELGTIFKEFYSGKKEPYVPARFLHLVWENCLFLRTKGQMDIQEFFLPVMSKLQEHCKGINGMGDNSCNSRGNIIDQCFHGQYLQVRICQNCQNICHVMETFYDVPLSMEPHEEDHAHNSNFTNNSDNGKTCNLSGKDSAQLVEMESLIACLNRYTSLKTLTDKDAKCESCGTKQNSTLQTSFMKLPIVLTFQLKRFKMYYTGKQKKAWKKNKAPVSFQETIDMRPFLCSTINDPDNIDNSTKIMDCKYSLFAVVQHLGSLEEGHYVSYIKQHKKRWFSCYDSVVKKVNTSEVLSAEAYILFYHKQILEYE